MLSEGDKLVIQELAPGVLHSDSATLCPQVFYGANGWGLVMRSLAQYSSVESVCVRLHNQS